MHKQFAVLGLGRFGYSLAETLAEMGHDVVAVDSEESLVTKIAPGVTQSIQADVREEQVLKSLGIRNFDTVIVAFAEDVQANVLVCMTLKELGVHCVAKAKNEVHGRVLEKIGVDKVIYPERDMGERVAHCLISSNIMDHIQISPDYSISEVVATSKIGEKSLEMLNFRSRFGVNVLAIKRGEDITVSPGADATVMGGDILVVLGTSKAIDKLGDLI